MIETALPIQRLAQLILAWNKKTQSALAAVWVLKTGMHQLIYFDHYISRF